MRGRPFVGINLEFLRVTATDKARLLTAVNTCCHELQAHFGHNAMPRLEDLVDTGAAARSL